MNKNHQISIAKKQAILMSDYGYLPPCSEKNIKFSSYLKLSSIADILD